MPQNQFYAPIGDLAKVTIPTIGGICKIQFIPVEDVASIAFPAMATGIVNAAPAVTLKAGKAWYTAKAAYQRGYVSTSKDTDAGPVVETVVNANLPFINDARHLVIDRIKFHRFILLVQRGDGSSLIVGSLDNPATVSSTENGGNTPSDQRGNTVTFTVTAQDYPLIWRV